MCCLFLNQRRVNFAAGIAILTIARQFRHPRQHRTHKIPVVGFDPPLLLHPHGSIHRALQVQPSLPQIIGLARNPLRQPDDGLFGDTFVVQAVGFAGFLSNGKKLHPTGKTHLRRRSDNSKGSRYIPGMQRFFNHTHIPQRTIQAGRRKSTQAGGGLIQRIVRHFGPCHLLRRCLDGSAEMWPSGRRRSPAKGVGPEGSRGFESLRLRHFTLSYVKSL